MKRYLLKRIGLSIVSMIIVIFIVVFLIYRVIDKESIFNQDINYSKLSGNTRELYRYNQFQNSGYLEYENFSGYLADKYRKISGDDFAENSEYKETMEKLSSKKNYDYFNKLYKNNNSLSISKSRVTFKLNSEYLNFINDKNVKEFYDEYRKKGYYIAYLIPDYSSGKDTLLSNNEGMVLAINEKNTFQRLGAFLGSLFKFETIYDVKDESLKDRYIKWIWDERSNMPALIGSGTTHKYLIYFDNQFPFIHQNIFHLRLGASNTLFEGKQFTDIVNTGTGNSLKIEQELPVDLGSGNKVYDSRDFHSVTYSATPSAEDALVYGEGEHYINAETLTSGFSRIGNSFVIGIIAALLAYIVGLPLGILMSRKKGKLPDKLGMGLIIFITAVPTLGYIFMFAGIGVTLFKLPYNWSFAAVPILAFILPTISLAMPQITGQMKWTRRFMIDQQNSDYVKFAKSQGLSEREIFSKHIFRNALIYLVHDIPAAFIFALTGAIITERVYSVPGVGGLLTLAIGKYDNGLIVAVTVFYTALSIIALLLGDLLLAKYDPRVSFTNSKG